jgi:exopolyphosphatase/guanosine-5'-triphosphate,3'-diphosphate pyrophosphatase
MRQAVLDLGLESLHLAVVEACGHGAGARILARRCWSETVRLGAASPDGMRVSPAAFARGFAAVERLLGDLAAFDPGCPVAAIASAALGAAAGGAAFCEEIERRYGIAVGLLTGDSEARLIYLGARSWSTADRLVVAELGSTSLELATGAGFCDLAFSVPVGVLGLRDVYLHPERGLDRAARERVAASVRFAAGDAARAIWDRRPDRLAFTSALPHALGALADDLELRPPGSDALGLSVVARLADVLSQFRPIELPALGVDEARSDTIAVGAVVLHTLMELCGMSSAVISPHGRREGAALLHLRGSPIPELSRVHLPVT